LTCCYGIELLADNIAECRANMLEVFADYLRIDEEDELYRAAFHILSQNLIHGDARTMRQNDGEPIRVVEWAYLGKGKFKPAVEDAWQTDLESHVDFEDWRYLSRNNGGDPSAIDLDT